MKKQQLSNFPNTQLKINELCLSKRSFITENFWIDL